MIPPRHRRFVTMPEGYQLSYDEVDDRSGVLYVFLVRARGLRLIHDEASEAALLADPTWRAQHAEARRWLDRQRAAWLAAWFAMIASWARPLPLMLSTFREPEPLVSQLVDDLVAAPHAPTSAGAMLLAA
jgi:hypothetical protein